MDDKIKNILLRSDMRNKTKNITLTLEQSVEAVICMEHELLEYERALEYWAKKSLEKGPDGTPTYEDAESNMEYYNDRISTIKEIIKMLG